MLPNLSRVIQNFSQRVELKRVEETIVNHRPQRVETSTPFMAVVQPADMQKIIKDKIDYRLKYVTVHSLQAIIIDDIIVHRGIPYHAFANADWLDYGYHTCTMEEIK